MPNGYENIYDPTQNSIIPSIPGMGETAQTAAVAGAGAASTGAGGLGTPDVEAANVNAPQVGGQGANGPSFFGKGGMAQVGLGAIQTLGSLWNSFQQNKIAKKSLALQERTFETNLSNQTKTYNTELEDRIRNRMQGAGKGLDSKEADSYIERNKL